MIQLIDAVPPRAYDWAGYELTQHAQHAADVHADRLTTYGSYDGAFYLRRQALYEVVALTT